MDEPWGSCYQTPDGFSVIATSSGALPRLLMKIVSIMMQFHPEVAHAKWRRSFGPFAIGICGCTGNWSMAAYRGRAIELIRAQVGDARVIAACLAVLTIGRSGINPSSDRRPVDLCVC